MRFLDLSSWQSILTSIAGLLLVTLIGMGIRLLMMMTLQQRRERQNRQINERLKALIAAYKVLGGSFTGTLAVSPLHLRDLRRVSLRPSGASTSAELAAVHEALRPPGPSTLRQAEVSRRPTLRGRPQRRRDGR